MCGRYAVLTEEENIEIKEIINEINERFKSDSAPGPSYKTGEIFPTDTVPVITAGIQNSRAVNLYKWGFPNYMKNSGVIINARSESLEEKPTFKRIIHTKRCLIPASGFFEWKKQEDKKQKYLIRVQNHELFYMAGLYNTFTDKAGNLFTGFVIITTEANEAMSEIHDRMPVILERNAIDTWLKTDIKDLTEIKMLLKPCENDWLKFLKVG